MNTSESPLSASVPDQPAAAVLSSLPNAGLLRRCGALIYDTLVLMGVSLVYGMIGFALKELVYGAVPEGNVPKGGPLLFIGWMSILVAFYVFFWKRAGQTVGMRAWRLKLIPATGDTLTWSQLLLRCALAVVGLLLLGLGYLWILFDRDHRSLHDRLSHTRIVKTVV